MRPTKEIRIQKRNRCSTAIQQVHQTGPAPVHFIHRIQSDCQFLIPVLNPSFTKRDGHIAQRLSGKSIQRPVQSSLPGQFDSKAFTGHIPYFHHIRMHLVTGHDVGYNHRSHSVRKRRFKADPNTVIRNFLRGFTYFHHNIAILVTSFGEYHKVHRLRLCNSLYIIAFIPRESSK